MASGSAPAGSRLRAPVACVYICENSHVKRRPQKHLGYYVSVHLDAHLLDKAHTVAADRRTGRPCANVQIRMARHLAASARIACREMVDFGFDVVIKFGMNLHRDPDDLPAGHGVLSFHHGDPSEYRGRPAGFYEVLDGADHVGTIVQRIGNKLDAGNVLAYAASQVAPHSYHQTLEGSTGIANTYWSRLSATPKWRSAGSPRYRQELFTSIQLDCRQTHRADGSPTDEESWLWRADREEMEVGRTNAIDPARAEHVVYLREPDDLVLPKGFAFTADPCPGYDGTIWCEGLETWSGKGRLLVFSPDRPPVAVDVPGMRGRHCSYPFIVESQGTRYVLPEMASVGPPKLFELEGASIVGSQDVRGLEEFRIIDPTVLFHAGRWWLFGGLPTTATDLLWLWSATDVSGPYEPHPDNPIVMDVARARSAGPIIAADGRLFRPGQDNRGSYGNGVTFSEIIELSTEKYHEVPRAQVRVAGRKGPHTLFLDGDSTVVDSYVERLSPLAGMTRLKNKVTFSRS